jgi:hypothetical protein
MRLLPVLLIALALAFAGCFGKKADNTPTDGGATTPTDTTPSTSGGSTPASSTPGGTDTNSTPPAALPPKQACSATVDFTEAPSGPAAPAPPTATPCNIDPGYTHLILNVTWALTTPAAPDPQPPSVAIGGATCALAGPVEQSAPAVCSKPGTATPGKMSITYGGGPAPITATVTVFETA